MPAQLRALPDSPPDDLDAIAARRAVLVAELADLAQRETAIVRAMADRAARLRPVALTIKEVAGSMRVAESTVRKWVREGLPAHRPAGGDTFIDLDQLSEWIRKQ